jgi:hypothetical protein
MTSAVAADSLSSLFAPKMPQPLCAPQYLTEERFLAIPK